MIIKVGHNSILLTSFIFSMLTLSTFGIIDVDLVNAITNSTNTTSSLSTISSPEIPEAVVEEEEEDESESKETFLTDTSPYLLPISGKSTIKPLITFNDVLDSDYVFQRIPDGLGAMINTKNNEKTISVFVNHELKLSKTGEYSKISNLTLNKDAEIIEGNLLENGSGKYEKLCSATLVEGNGFPNPLFITNEEMKDGKVVAYNLNMGNKTELPWLGYFAHENTIVLPNSSFLDNKTVLLSSEDYELDQSQLYMYVANDTIDILKGNGQLYVLAGSNNNNISSFRDFQKGSAYQVYFEPLTWDWRTQNYTDLENEVQSKNAIDFTALEDLDYDKHQNNIIYLADTGDKDAGDNYKNGRIYTIELPQKLFGKIENTIKDSNSNLSNNVIDIINSDSNYNSTANNSNNPNPRYYAEISVLLDGDDGDDIRNPDNIAITSKSLMIQENLKSYNKMKNGVNAKILKFDLGNHRLEPVAIINQFVDIYNNPKAGSWEPSGIINTDGIFGEGTWLTTVQAHSKGEGGQLLLMNITNS